MAEAACDDTVTCSLHWHLVGLDNYAACGDVFWLYDENGVNSLTSG